MGRAMYLRQQAEVLLGLSRATIDLGVARRLRSLAAEFQAKAEEVEDAESDFPTCPSGGVVHRAGTWSATNFAYLGELIPRPAFVCPEEISRDAAMSKAEEAF